MKQLDFKKVMKRFEKAKANKELWRTRLRDCYRLAYPEGNIFDTRVSGQDNNEELFDSTAINALQRYATKMVMQLIPPHKKWINLEAGSEVAEEDKEQINAGLDEMTDILFEHISNSNIISQAQEAFLDAGISTGALIQEDGDLVDTFLNYRAVPAAQLILERTREGTDENVYREFEIPAQELEDTFPLSKDKWTADIVRKMEDSPQDLVKVIEGELKDSEDGKFFNFLIDVEGGRFVYQFKNEVTSWIVFREHTMPNEVYGRGRVMRSLDDIKTLNELSKFNLISAAYNSPIFTATDDGIINAKNLVIQPNTTIPVDSNDPRAPSISQLNVNTGTGSQMDMIRYYQSLVNESLLMGVFGDIEETPVRTASEMQMRKSDSDEAVAGATGNFFTEFVRPLVDGAMYRLKKAGKIADIKADNKLIKVKYSSPASRLQTMSELQDLSQGLSMIASMPEQAQTGVKWSEIPKYVFDTMGLPLDLVKTSQEVQIEQQQAMKQQQAMIEAEQRGKADGAVQVEQARGDVRIEQERVRGENNV